MSDGKSYLNEIGAVIEVEENLTTVPAGPKYFLKIRLFPTKSIVQTLERHSSNIHVSLGNLSTSFSMSASPSKMVKKEFSTEDVDLWMVKDAFDNRLWI
jgi:hypothetical protein